MPFATLSDFIDFQSYFLFLDNLYRNLSSLEEDGKRHLKGINDFGAEAKYKLLEKVLSLMIRTDQESGNLDVGLKKGPHWKM
jgi:hypothetical protein